MTRLCSLALLLLIYTACSKGPIYLKPLLHPPMHYTNVKMQVRKGTNKQVDIDDNGIPDFSFGTLLVSEPLKHQDRLQFYAYSKAGTNLLDNEKMEGPAVAQDACIAPQYAGYQWGKASAVLLVEKIMPAKGHVVWQGAWKGANHHYLPVQLRRQGNPYLGWMDLSFDTSSERLTVYRFAISQEPGRAVVAGF